MSVGGGRLRRVLYVSGSAVLVVGEVPARGSVEAERQHVARREELRLPAGGRDLQAGQRPTEFVVADGIVVTSGLELHLRVSPVERAAAVRDGRRIDLRGVEVVYLELNFVAGGLEDD